MVRIVKFCRDDCEFFLVGVFDFFVRVVECSCIDEYVDVVFFLGYVIDMLSLFKEVDCFVFFFYYFEGIFCSLIEVVVVGKFIIIMDMFGCCDVIDGNGIIVLLCFIESLVLVFEEVVDMKFIYRFELMMWFCVLVEFKYDENIVIN